jgi:pimeloyl-ACP methyl ester carboxylesterase
MATTTTQVEIRKLEERREGKGSPVVFLHGMNGLLFAEPFIQQLAKSHEVIIPIAPGWGEQPLDPAYRSLDDIAYACLDLLDSIGGTVPVIGSSIGAWLAAEVATKACEHIESLVLVSPIGVRTGEPTERMYVDLYGAAPETVSAAMYGETAKAPDRTALSDAQFLELARAEESTAYFGWEPYMHNPSLLERLHRISVPTLLVSGERDGFVLRDNYLDLFEERLPKAAAPVVIPGAGHRVEETAPAELAAAIDTFLGTVA